jgi:hypothetical protein
MKKIVLIALLGLTISSCGPVLITGDPGRRPHKNPPGWERNEDRRGRSWEENREWNNGSRKYDKNRNSDRYSYLLFININPRYRDVTIVINDRHRIDISNYRDNRSPKEVRVKPGRYNIKVYVNGRYLYSRWIDTKHEKNIRIVI